MRNRLTSLILLITLFEFIQCQETTEEVEINPEDELHSAIVEHVLNQANKPIWFHLEKPVNPFIGRTTELDELRSSLQQKQIVIIQGQRGIGKTELARKYAQNMKHDNTSNIVWLDSSTHESLISSFKDLLVEFGSRVEGKSMTAVLTEAFNFFKARKSVFILDQAGSDNLILKHLSTFMPSSKRTQIIVTSRDNDWDESYQVIKLKTFTKENSLEYLHVKLRKEINMNVISSSAERVAEFLKHLPLALQKAVNYIVHKNTIWVDREYTLDNYIEDLVKKQMAVEASTTTTTQTPTTTSAAMSTITTSSTMPASSSTTRKSIVKSTIDLIKIENEILNKIKQESKTIKNKMETGAKEAWELLADETTNVGKQVKKVLTKIPLFG